LKRRNSSDRYDIELFPLQERQVEMSFDDLLSAAQTQNPDIAAAHNMIERQRVQVDAAHKES
jgi:outer membrane protein TolC